MTKADPIVPPDLEKFTLRQETPYPFRRRGKLQDLPILIDGIRYRTIPDTGASFNAISYSFLQHMSLKKVIAMSDILESCKVGDGRCVEAVGQVDIDVSFPDSPQAVSSQIFRVYDTLADGVTIIVGKPFLDATQTLTKYCWRLVERMRHCPIVPRFMNLMPPQAWLKVYINSIMAFASADTGSELDLVWLDFAIRRDLQISPLNDSDEMRVQLADGRIKQLRGKVCVHFGVLNGVTQNSNQGSDLPQLASLASNLLSKEGLLKGEEATGKQSDEIQDTTKGREMAQLRSVDCSRGNLSRDRPAAVSEVEPQKNCTKVFYVIDELCCDVCLGQETLDSMDAFNAYPEAFVDIMKDKLKAELDKSEPQLCGIFKLQHFQRRWYHFLERHGAQVTNIDGQLSSPPVSKAEFEERVDQIDQRELGRADGADKAIKLLEAREARLEEGSVKNDVRAERRRQALDNKILRAQYLQERKTIFTEFEKTLTAPPALIPGTDIRPSQDAPTQSQPNMNISTNHSWWNVWSKR